MSDAETVVLIHGLSETRDVWSRQVAALQSSMHVLAYDVRGFGSSPTGAADGTVRQFADDLAQFLSAHAAAPAWLVGFSMGGVIAQRFALDFPELSKGLVLIASSCTVGRGGQEFFKNRIEAVETGGLASLAKTNDADARSCFWTDNEDLINEYSDLRTGAVIDPLGYLNACHAMLGIAAEPLTDQIAAIRQPTLVISGEHDPYCPPKAAAMISKAIPGAELLVIDAVGHCLQFEASDTLNQAIADFVSTHSTQA
ncbi:MAG: alpha/beta fold hydrolase [Proteobacteria bacterium]|nr:alpha/beta fold hydrolase [Pseudomonadota bacterium]